MTRKKTTKKTDGKVRHHNFKKVSEETLTAMAAVRQKADLAAAEAQNLQTSFRLMVAKELDKHDQPIQTSTICMNCGTIFPQNVPCPECPPPPPQRMQRG